MKPSATPGRAGTPHVNVDSQGRLYLDNGTSPTKEQAERIANSSNSSQKLLAFVRHIASMDRNKASAAARDLLSEIGELE